MENPGKNSLDKRISYYENPAYKLERDLLDKGYEIANLNGVRESKLNHCVFGILKPRRDIIKKSFLGFKSNKKQRALFLGRVWLSDQDFGAKPDKRWVLEVYGRQNIEELTGLIKELSEPSGVDVQVRLGSEESKFEAYIMDFAGP